MSAGEACRNREHRGSWRVAARRSNSSAFSGYRLTPSRYSEIRCVACGGRKWRTTAAYVDQLPDITEEDWAAIACAHTRPVTG